MHRRSVHLVSPWRLTSVVVLSFRVHLPTFRSKAHLGLFIFLTKSVHFSSLYIYFLHLSISLDLVVLFFRSQAVLFLCFSTEKTTSYFTPWEKVSGLSKYSLRVFWRLWWSFVLYHCILHKKHSFSSFLFPHLWASRGTPTKDIC